MKLEDARNRFSAVVDAAMAGRPQQVTRRGKPAVVILSAAEYRRLTAAAARSRGSFADHLASFPAPEGFDPDRAQAAPREVEL